MIEGISLRRTQRASKDLDAGVSTELVLLSFASGCVDVLSYLQLGQVFTSAMTGNSVLLGLSIGQGNVSAISRNAAALLSFLVGLLLGAVMLRMHRGKSGRSPAITRAFIVETILLLGFAGLWQIDDGPASSEWLLYSLIALSAVAMGLQSSIAHHIGVPGMSTTYFTGTLTNIVNGATSLLLNRKPSVRHPRARTGWQAAAFIAYIAAAALTGLLAIHPLTAAMPNTPVVILPMLPAVALLLVLLVGAIPRFKTTKATRDSTSAAGSRSRKGGIAEDSH